MINISTRNDFSLETRIELLSWDVNKINVDLFLVDDSSYVKINAECVTSREEDSQTWHAVDFVGFESTDIMASTAFYHPQEHHPIRVSGSVNNSPSQ